MTADSEAAGKSHRPSQARCTCFVGEGLPRQHTNDCARNATQEPPR